MNYSTKKLVQKMLSYLETKGDDGEAVNISFPAAVTPLIDQRAKELGVSRADLIRYSTTAYVLGDRP